MSRFYWNILLLHDEAEEYEYKYTEHWGTPIFIRKNYFSSFVPNAPFPYLTVFWCFQGVEKGCIGNKWFKTGLWDKLILRNFFPQFQWNILLRHDEKLGKWIWVFFGNIYSWELLSADTFKKVKYWKFQLNCFTLAWANMGKRNDVLLKILIYKNHAKKWKYVII